MKKFDKWINTFFDEKGIDLEETFEIKGPSGMNYMPYGVVIEHIKTTGPIEQDRIKFTIVQHDFRNIDPRQYLRHLAQAIVR